MTEETNDTEYLDAEQAAAFLGVKVGTLNLYARKGRITRYRRGVPAKTLYRRKALEALKEIKQVKVKPKKKES